MTSNGYKEQLIHSQHFWRDQLRTSALWQHSQKLLLSCDSFCFPLSLSPPFIKNWAPPMALSISETGDICSANGHFKNKIIKSWVHITIDAVSALSRQRTVTQYGSNSLGKRTGPAEVKSDCFFALKKKKV